MFDVFRIQNAVFGFGPWIPTFSDTWTEDRAEEEFKALAPLPVNEVIEAMRRTFTPESHFGFGCETIGALQRWILPKEYSRLRLAGFQAVRMEVDEILIRHPVQVFFRSTKPLRHNVQPFNLY